jgi:hypothetical protein
MFRSRTISIATALVASLAFLSVGIGAASATPSHWQTEHDEYGPFVLEDFCGVTDLTVEAHGVADGRSRWTTHGPHGMGYLYDRLHFIDTYTNVETGAFVTYDGRSKNDDLRVTSNGDGTLTVLVRVTPHSTMYGEDGQVLGRRIGQFRFEVLYNDGGTPYDRDDDEELERQTVKSVGQTFDFCATLTEAIG